MTLHDKLVALADRCGEPFVGARATFRALAIASARMALEEAARECGDRECGDRDCGIRECCIAERAKAVQQCADTIRALAATLGDGSAPSS